MKSRLSERVSRRLAALAGKRGFKKDLAARLGFGPSWVSPYTSGERVPTLDILEAMSELSGVPLAEIVAEPGTIYQLDGDEAQLIRAVRTWPKPVVHALLAFLAFWADEAPTETRTRKVHEYWRGLSERDQEFVFGVLVMLREGMLPPDLQAKLLRLLKDEGAQRAARERHDDGA